MSFLIASLAAIGCGPAAERGATLEPTPSDAAPQAVALDPAIGDPVLAAMDPGVDPCTDFYRYACGGWIASTEPPADQARWMRGFSQLREQNLERLRALVEGLDPADATGDAARLAAFYRACTDEAAIDAAGAAPLRPWLDRIADVASPAELLALAGELERLDVEVFFGTWVGPDASDPGRNLLYLTQGGLGLPDRDFYLTRGAGVDAAHAAYRRLLEDLFALAGDDVATATQRAANALAFEGDLAASFLDRDAMRDPGATFDTLERGDLAERAPLPWEAWFAALGAPEVEVVSVHSAAYFEALADFLAETPLEVLRDYMAARVLVAMAPRLSAPFEQAHFELYGRALQGQTALAPRWRRCLELADWGLGDALGQLWVEAWFAGESKARAVALVEAVQQAFGESLARLPWMDADTRAEARVKLERVADKIGYPEVWRSYEALELPAGVDWFTAANRVLDHEAGFYLDMIGAPVDRTLWQLTAPTVNATYEGATNELVFPAGILQPPFFHADFPSAMNYGAIGMVVGHELSHAFDEAGRHYDADGRPRDWWSAASAQAYRERAACVEVQSSAYALQPGALVDASPALGEHLADLAGLELALRAWRASRAAEGTAPVTLGGLSEEALFFVAFAQVWCTVAGAEDEQLRARTDTHAASRYRVNGTLANLEAFGEVFGCAASSPMQNGTMCEVW